MTLNRDFDLDCLIVSNFLKLNPDYKNCEFIPINGWKYFCSKLHDKGGDFCLFSSFLKKEVNCSILPLITFSWEIIQISTAVYKMCWFFKKIFFCDQTCQACKISRWQEEKYHIWRECPTFWSFVWRACPTLWSIVWKVCPTLWSIVWRKTPT